MQPKSCIIIDMMISEDNVFKALSDASRRALLDQLFQNGGLTLSELCMAHDMSRQAVTKHLAILEDANLVIVRWQGREKRHYLNPAPIHDIYTRWISKFDTNRLELLSALKETLEES